MLDIEPGDSLMMIYRPASLSDVNTSSKMFLTNNNTGLDTNGIKTVTAVNASFSLIFKYLTETQSNHVPCVETPE